MKLLNKEGGLTLVEILVAIILISIILLSFFTFFTQSTKFTQHNKAKLTSVDIAEQVVADLRRIDSPEDLLQMGYHKQDNTYIKENTDLASKVEIDFEENTIESELRLAKVTIYSSKELKRPPFKTEMYIKEGNSYEK
ncbi:hypothetical protein SLU01_06350 [Sporosarcina luteola]|uniref:Prepilin-type N-terminal cleavage/methylation domain-containing protein n=1 Tax=Sporosarcina luteola TaxID=582850 RepID=A0A511Z4E4_9BACL|nr:prepilin-type N-terminal cleavage/methylation domain-containing protein [Sporosarcina luteola]GEN82323.1 hypothetical protein SLU01_06350 [Sporosarcina luteola]